MWEKVAKFLVTVDTSISLTIMFILELAGTIMITESTISWIKVLGFVMIVLAFGIPVLILHDICARHKICRECRP